LMIPQQGTTSFVSGMFAVLKSAGPTIGQQGSPSVKPTFLVAGSAQTFCPTRRVLRSERLSTSNLNVFPVFKSFAVTMPFTRSTETISQQVSATADAGRDDFLFLLF